MKRLQRHWLWILIALAIGIGLILMTRQSNAISNPFKKSTTSVSISDSLNKLGDAVNDYVKDANAQMQAFSKGSQAAENFLKGGIFSKPVDMKARFKSVQAASDNLESAIDSDPKASSMKNSVLNKFASLREKVEKMRIDVSVITRRGPLFYDDVKRAYTANEQKMPSNNRVTVDNVYTFLGYASNEEGKKKSVDEINNKIKIWRGTSKLNVQDRDSLARQLGYYFGSPYSKQEFDAYVTGRGAMDALILSNRVIEDSRERYLESTQLIGMLNDLTQQIQAK